MQKRFSNVYIEITNVCNLRCAFCPGTKRNPEFMPLDKFEKIAEQVKPLTEQILLHVMGEPLLHPHSTEIIQAAAREKLPVTVTTNGTLLESPQAESLLNPTVRQVNISLHSLYRNDKKEKNDERLKEIFLFTRKAFEKNPDLYINYRLWNLSHSEESLDTEYNEWICRKIETEFNLKIPVQGHSKGRKSRRLIYRLYLHLDTRFKWPEISSESTKNTKGTCHALSRQIAILTNGTVVPCCLDRNGVIPLGNSFNETLASIINSERAILMLSGFRKGILVEKLCRNCGFCSRFSSKRAVRHADSGIE